MSTRRRPTKQTAKKPTRARRTTSTSRRRNSTATTFGAATGTIVMAFLLGAPWSVRIALIVLVVLGGVGYLLWSRRS